MKVLSKTVINIRIKIIKFLFGIFGVGVFLSSCNSNSPNNNEVKSDNDTSLNLTVVDTVSNIKNDTISKIVVKDTIKNNNQSIINKEESKKEGILLQEPMIKEIDMPIKTKYGMPVNYIETNN